MSRWLRLLCVVLIALLAGSASAGAANFGPRAGDPIMHHIVDFQPNAHCDHCVGNEAVTCAELCVGSLYPERETGVVHLDTRDTFLRRWADNLREGLLLPPNLTPPIA